MSFVLPINAAGLGLGDEDTDVSGADTYALTMGTKPADGTTTGNPFPKGTGGSNSFRIPAMVTLNDGTIVAAADARWNTTYDGGGLDTIVSRSSDGGATWNYTFANYLGDNGNTYNGSGSTAFIDPALATDGSTIYMLCDLYPYGIALNGDGTQTTPSTEVGFNSDGNLKLAKSGSSSYDYYLKNNTIYDSSNNPVDENYFVDAHFNIYEQEDGEVKTYVSNLFFADSPYKVVRTGYLYLTVSYNGGATWSNPTLLPGIKTTNEQVCLVGPGRGIVTSNNVIFPVYSFHGDNNPSSNTQRLSFISLNLTTGEWSRSTELNYDWASEAAVVQLTDGTLRFFFRNGTKQLCYVDYNNGWGTPVPTGIATNSNTQISAITYSETTDNGKQVILVSCPTGPSENGSNSSSAGDRLNGKIFVGVVQDDKTMDWEKGTTISVPSVNSSKQFMYSCLTELKGGDIAILYEDLESAWGDGYYTMSYATYGADTLGLSFDGAKTDVVDTTGLGITAELPEGSTMTATDVTATGTISGVTDGEYVAYDITINGGEYTGSAVITLPIGNLDTSKGLYGFVVENDIAKKIDGGKLDSVNRTFTFTAPHFSTVGVAVQATTTKTEPVELKVGETKTYEDNTGNYEKNNANNKIPTDGVVDVKLKGEDKSEPTYDLVSITERELVTAAGSNTSWTAASGYYYKADDGQYYQVYARYSSSNYSRYSCGYYKTGANDISSISGSWFGYSTVSNIYTQSSTSRSAYTDITIKGLKPGTATVVVGDTTYNVTVNEIDKKVTESVAVGNAITLKALTDAGLDNSYSVTYATTDTTGTITLNASTGTVTGNKEGTATVIATITYNGVTVGTVTYTISVNDGTPITITEGQEYTINVTLVGDQYVKWSSEDGGHVGVAGQYSTTYLKYTDSATLYGHKVTDAGSPIRVTGTVYNADGSVARTEIWLVTVTEGGSSGKVSRYFDVDQALNCTVYYSINGGPLIPVNGTGVSIIPNQNDHSISKTVIGGEWYGDLSLMFFAAPKDGYALTHLYIEDSDGQYYTLSDGDGDVTKSSAWPFADNVNTNAIYTSGGHTYSIEEIASLYKAGYKDDADPYGKVKNSTSVWKTIDGNLHGYRWALLEGYVTPDSLKSLFDQALALGCTGVTTVTKSSTSSANVGTTDDPISVCAVAQPLPTVDKEVTKITNSNGNDITNTGKVTFGDTIHYTVTVTIPATSELVTYWDGTRLSTTLKLSSGSTVTNATTISYTDMSVTDSLKDFITGFDWTTKAVTSSTTEGADQTYKINYTITLTKENFGKIVTEGTITNVATFEYTYKATFGKGTLKKSDDVKLDVTVDVPDRVLDFGLPVEIDLTEAIHSLFNESTVITNVKSTVGNTVSCTTNDCKLIYTPKKVLDGTDYVELTLSDGHTFGVNIHPASNVLYEDNFLTAGSGSGAEWTGSSIPDTAKQDSDSNTLYGYDVAYATSKDNSFGSAWTATLDANGPTAITNFLTTTFYGNGFDLIGTTGPTTGYVFVTLVGSGKGNNYLVMVDTSYMGGGTLHQVPLVHLENLTPDTYTVNILGGYRAATTGTSTNAATYGMYGGSTAVDSVYAALDQLYAAGYDFDDVEFVYFDEGSPLAGMDNASAVYASETGSTTGSTKRDAGDTVTIDGFRVYRDSSNSAYIPSERDITYVNVLDAVKYGDELYYYAVTENEGAFVLTENRTKYESAGGPQNEIYLGENQAIVLSSSLAEGKILQVSARAVTGTSTQINDSINIASNTEMYYLVTVGQDGTIVIKNTGNGMLALGNLKVLADTEFNKVTEATLSIASEMLRSYAAGSDQPEPTPDPTPVIPRPTPVFTPDRLTVGVKSFGLFRTRINTVTITTSTDVVRLTVDDKELRPTNSLLVQMGLNRYYTYTLVDTAKKNESRSYEVIAYNANGVASKTRIAKG